MVVFAVTSLSGTSAMAGHDRHEPILDQYKEDEHYVRHTYSKDRCPSCKGKMPSALALYVHPKCYRQNQKQFIASHVEKHIESQGTWICNKCNAPFDKHCQLHDHYEVHLTHEEKLYECLHCHDRFGRRVNVQKHIHNDHLGKIIITVPPRTPKDPVEIKPKMETKTEEEKVSAVITSSSIPSFEETKATVASSCDIAEKASCHVSCCSFFEFLHLFFAISSWILVLLHCDIYCTRFSVVILC